MVTNVWWALLFPIVGFLYCVFLGRLSRWLTGWVATLAIGASFIAALSVLSGLLALPAADRSVNLVLYTWISSGSFHIPFGVQVDPLSVLMLLIVTGVSFLIHLYAQGYMAEDRSWSRFFAYMNLFVAAMLTLVLSNNFVLLMVGWGGVGLCSYLLIAFWFDKPEAAAAGVKAFVVNAIGDAGLILGVSLILIKFHSAEFQTVLPNASRVLHVGGGTVTAITLLLLVAAVAKSAQLPLYVWLPDAMAGPTPVSALIHAATMVTAGVYLIARASPLFVMAPFTMGLIAWIGAITALFAATIGLVKPNIKRVLAYSTVSQLGYMFLAVGLGGFAAGMFHLMTHAFFKALLFLAAGAVIHALAGEEDMQRMGGLGSKLPLTFATYAIAGLAISGFPGLAGFYSKDEIISLAFSPSHGNVVLGLIALFTAGLTAVYIFRTIFVTFLGKSRVDPHVEEHLHAPGATMTVPLVVLAVLAVVGGYFEFPGDRLTAFLAPAFTQYGVTSAGEAGLNVPISIASSILAIGGIVLAWLIWGGQGERAEALGKQFGGIRTVLLNDYGVDALYNTVVVGSARSVGRFCSDLFDPAVIDGIVNGVAGGVWGLSKAVGQIESGYIRSYALFILAGAFLVVLYLARVGV